VQATELLRGLSFYEYEWTDEAPRDGSGQGMMAQDVQERMPWVVNERDEEINNQLTFDRLQLIQPTAAAVSELIEQFDDHEERITDLEEENKRLRKEIEALRQ